MRIKPASLSACVLFKFIVFILPSAAVNIACAVVRAFFRRLTLAPSIENGFARAIMTNLSADEIQAALPSTIDTYVSWCTTASYAPTIHTLADGVTRLLWLDRQNASTVLLFFHGGGYVMPLSPGHLQWMAHIKEKAAEAGVDLDCCVLEYDLVPTHPYPKQMIQAILAFKHLLAFGYSPSDIVIGGDSAGGHLAISLLSHLHHPRPNPPNGPDIQLDLKSTLKGCFVVSPLTSFNLTSRSYNTIFSTDVLCKKNVAEWGELLIAKSPWHEEISQGHGWGMPLDVPESWWDGLDIVEHILVTGGDEEVFRDHIEQFVDVLRRKARARVVAHIAADEAHDAPLMDFSAGRAPRDSTQLIVEWILERVGK